MTAASRGRLRDLNGPLFFPVTAFAPDGGLELDAYRAHVGAGVAAGAGAVFACCGTGEFPALTPEEYRDCVAAAVRATRGRVPVVAGTGYGTGLALRYARLAEAAGADGLLAMPPYLVTGDQAGLLRHYTALAAGTALDIVVYQRGTAVLTPRTVVELARTPGIAGLKDGLGDLELMRRIVSAVRDQAPGSGLRYVNGLPTAELTAPAYRGIGVRLYSSAVFGFAPEIALAFQRALTAGDTTTVGRLLDGFYRPLAELRDQGEGYAVSLVKAAVRLRGCPVGGVRPPLSDPTAAHLAELGALIDRGLALAAEG
ncbi:MULTISPECIES: 5-dehydro-4-deoxyglucarate dehydratase [Streptomycetaceae]|uniref:Probable 5-dehydro-4-deoxyglucarate dehydratase n=1 Tax=Streptantibioticus cattleyicolor (strain ATCC 35852 / DSM 46488 / JCM 4925 / NBRC 14057 / NRRL 8057) TaxID=1003195 RepID=F8JYW8_STREN|nr:MULTISPECIES: 5-dehydro-4-deoxyglucarate dehydratase [Streptomycetaceae]AEW93440.1 dihydrodipicolinate synthetase [Streptantibioticus cattleyicolor NRRL 8057 = DSM 46488]MYS58152.1 5-dehydro-4-deoxyglucarate dehydratase [Streptomyces sp. SID5468]CCB73794.1 putative 5-dehydro-4-deoxyglucarate dehydratase 1 [Streptantibioticus cattleyicolor NRRL 8057 = DSM 46488]